MITQRSLTITITITMDAFPEGRLRSGATITMDAFGVGAFPEGRLSLWTALPRSAVRLEICFFSGVQNLFGRGAGYCVASHRDRAIETV